MAPQNPGKLTTCKGSFQWGQKRQFVGAGFCFWRPRINLEVTVEEVNSWMLQDALTITLGAFWPCTVGALLTIGAYLSREAVHATWRNSLGDDRPRDTAKTCQILPQKRTGFGSVRGHMLHTWARVSSTSCRTRQAVRMRARSGEPSLHFGDCRINA